MMQLEEHIALERFPRKVNINEETVPLLDLDENVEELEARLQEQLEAGNTHLLFPIGQFYYDQKKYDKALHYFEMARSNHYDWQALFQLGVMYYDGIGCEPDIKKGFEYMQQVASTECSRAKHLVRSAQFNIGRAYYQGYGVKRSEAEAERYWLLAADNGNLEASIKAQTTLGLFYSHPDRLDLKKAFYWHSEACGNGSLESQGALGVMYNEGLGIKQDLNSAFVCLKDAASRGNIYAMGHLVAYYYQRKLYAKSVELASHVSMLDDVSVIAIDTDCMECYIKKGISMASFYYAVCLSTGRGVCVDEKRAKAFFSRSFKFDPDTCARLQKMVQLSEI